MTDKAFLTHGVALRHVRLGVLGAVICALGLGCGAFNPAFLNLLDTRGTGVFATLDNAPGHVAIMLVNSVDIDDTLLAFMDADGSLNMTNAEKAALRPRLRIRVQVTFRDGTIQTIEFIDGSRDLVEKGFAAEAEPDLNQNDLDNVVVLCDVASVEIAPPDIEVFLPVSLLYFSEEEIRDATGNPVTIYRYAGELPPQFRRLEVDEVDEDGNVTVQHNIGPRDTPSPAIDPLCGSVVVITVNGVLKVPFLTAASTRPSYSSADNATVSRIGGRYEFIVSVN